MSFELSAIKQTRKQTDQLYNISIDCKTVDRSSKEKNKYQDCKQLQLHVRGKTDFTRRFCYIVSGEASDDNITV